MNAIKDIKKVAYTKYKFEGAHELNLGGTCFM